MHHLQPLPEQKTISTTTREVQMPEESCYQLVQQEHSRLVACQELIEASRRASGRGDKDLVKQSVSESPT
jgi:hypothetical protein